MCLSVLVFVGALGSIMVGINKEKCANNIRCTPLCRPLVAKLTTRDGGSLCCEHECMYMCEATDTQRPETVLFDPDF